MPEPVRRSGMNRWWPTLRVAGFLICLLVVTAFSELGAALALQTTGLVRATLLDSNMLTRPAVIVVYGAALLATFGVVVLFQRAFERRRPVSFGLSFASGWVRELGLGIAMGFGLMLAIALIEVGSGWYRLDGIATAATSLAVLPVTLVLFTMVAFVEEVAFRGYVQRVLDSVWGAQIALFASAMIFAAFHALNSNSGVIPVLTLVVAGLLLGAGYLASGRLWLPVGLHFAWNFAQGPVLGFPVSGNHAGGILQLTPVGPAALTGGAFGPEASAVGVAAEVLGVAVIWYFAAQRRLAP